MNISPQKPSSLGHAFIAFARSRLPIPNRPRIRNPRPFLAIAPIPFAPLVNTHAFPPPPYSVHPDNPAEFLRVPHNTPEQTAVERRVITNATPSHQLVGLGLEGVEGADADRFDGLGRLSGGFRGTGTSEALREEMHRMLREHSERRRTRAMEQPTKRQDVFYGSVDEGREQVVGSVTAKSRMRRRSAASPTPFERLRRGTISTEMKRAASLERRTSLHASRVWRV